MSAPSPAEAFRERGFVVARGLLSPEQVTAYRGQLERLSGRTRDSFDSFRIGPRRRGRGLYRAWTLADGVSKTPVFWPLAMHPPLLRAVREVLGPEVRYLQHTDLHVGFSAVTWHRDSVNRGWGVGPDWDESGEPYRIVRVGFYLQAPGESGFALRLVPGSHRLDLPSLERRSVERATGGWRQALALAIGRDPLAGRAQAVEAGGGDAVLFDPRVLHAGSFISGPKYSIFLAYGVPGAHFARHRQYYRHVRRELGYRPLDPRLADLLRDSGLDPAEEPAPATLEAWRPRGLERFLTRRVGGEGLGG